MNKIYLLTAAFAVMASLSGCSDTELASIDTAQEKTPIGFHTVGSQMGSRATIIDNSNLTDYSFNVYAFNRNDDDGSDGTVFMCINDESHNNNGVNISYKGGKWDYTTSTDLKYWPTGALNFYAVSPAKEPHLFSWQISQDSKEIKVTTFDEYKATDPDDIYKNVDVMYAISKNQTKTLTNGGTVHMQFRHILSQVAFKARTETPDMKVTIKGIKIYNFYFSGTFTLPTTDDAPTRNNWSFPLEGGYTTNGFTAVKDKSIDVGNTAISISTDEPMLFIPQELKKWTTTAASPRTTAQAKIDKESYLEISCRIQQNGTYLFGKNDFETLYVPFSAIWEPGKRYVYTLIFGGGYDKDGKPILTPVNFTASAENWNEDDGNSTNGNDKVTQLQ